MIIGVIAQMVIDNLRPRKLFNVTETSKITSRLLKVVLSKPIQCRFLALTKHFEIVFNDFEILLGFLLDEILVVFVALIQTVAIFICLLYVTHRLNFVLGYINETE